MPVKIKFRLAAMKEAMPKAKEVFNNLASFKLGQEVNREISSGKSPVQGVGRFKDYSDSYKDAIEENEGIMRGTDGKLWSGKRVRPVNLFVSGTMQKSQRITEKDGKIQLSYTSKFAVYHNVGTLKMPRRPMLPTDKGETFSRSITKFLYDTAKKAIYLVIKK